MKNFRRISLIFCGLFLMAASLTAQRSMYLEHMLNYKFNHDSLAGFDEAAASRSAIDEHFTGQEFPVRMFQLKRQFINAKYNIGGRRALTEQEIGQQVMAYTRRVPACTNEDFEASQAGAVTASLQVNGWTVTRGLNQSPPSGANSCNLLSCCPTNPQESEVINAPNGYIDPVIGAGYPIFSVFGSAPGTTAGNTTNSHIAGGVNGETFFRLNSSNNNLSMERISKTFTVTPLSALFQFAFIASFSTGHGCCDAGAFQIKIWHGCNTPTVITCPQFTASAPSSACANTINAIQWLNCGTNPPSNGTPYAPATLSSYLVFNKWQLGSLDLSAYINECVTIDIVSSDCNAGGHYGYVYFDAQCGPMVITGNGTPFPAGTQSMVVPTCGAAGATMCATPGMGQYSWAGPNVPQSYATPAFSNQCFTSSVSAQYTLSMYPPGGCPPITKVINTTITPAPLINASVVQASCGQTLAIVSVTPGGSAGNPQSLTWWPPPLSLNSQTTQGTYVIPTGTAGSSPPITVSITVSDQLGCKATTTAAVMPAAPIPTFAVNNLSNTYTINCFTPSVTLDVVTSYTYGNLNYFWASNSFTATTSNITALTPGNYTVTISDNVSGCASTSVVAIGSNTVAPISSNSPSFQTINCSVTAQGVDIISTNPTVNVTHTVVNEIGAPYSTNSYSFEYNPGGPGNYTVFTQNQTNGCVTVKVFTVSSNQGFPTMTVNTTPLNFTVGCASKSVTVLNYLLGQTTPSGGAVSYSLIPPSGSTVLIGGPLTPTTTYSLSVPGSYTAVIRDNVSFCTTRVPFSILSNTAGPSIDQVIVPEPILTCAKPVTTLKGISTNTNVSYNWGFTGNPGNIAGDTITVKTITATPTKTVIDNYTLTITDNNSLCKSFTVVPIRQNLYPPIPIITNGGTKSLTCLTTTIMLSNQSKTSIPPNSFYPGNAPGSVVGMKWEGPTPQLPTEEFSSSYIAFTPGIYTMTALDLNNGCMTKTTTTIEENRFVPVITTKQHSIDCGATSEVLTPQVIFSGTAIKDFTWTVPPGVPVGNLNIQNLPVTVPGLYSFKAIDKNNGCSSTADYTVRTGTLTANFVPDQTFGYAPMTVNFENRSHSSDSLTGQNGVNSWWIFGNASTASYSSVAGTAALYNQPGTYTVTLFVQKGKCEAMDTAVINVEVPSQLIVPNIFTPNGDGSNDLFFLQRASNLAEIHIKIFDRWGNLVYELETVKGQIEWDGKNQAGKEVPDGVYFYSIKATGKDSKTYDQKGSVTLMR
jgi:gliding motility-associated-like protein